MSKSTDTRHKILKQLTEQIAARTTSLRLEESFPSADQDSSESRITKLRREVEFLRRIRLDYEEQMFDPQ